MKPLHTYIIIGTFVTILIAGLIVGGIFLFRPTGVIGEWQLQSIVTVNNGYSDEVVRNGQGWSADMARTYEFRRGGALNQTTMVTSEQNPEEFVSQTLELRWRTDNGRLSIYLAGASDQVLYAYTFTVGRHELGLTIQLSDNMTVTRVFNRV